MSFELPPTGPVEPVADTEAVETDASIYPSGSIGAMFPEVAALMEGLLAERNTLEAQLRDARAEVERVTAALRKRNAAPDDERLARLLDRAERQKRSRSWRAVGWLVRQVQSVIAERDDLRAELAAERAKVERVRALRTEWAQRSAEDRNHELWRALGVALTGGEQIRTTISNTSMPPEEYFR